MAKSYSIYLNEELTQTELYDFAVNKGGVVQELSNSYSQVAIQADDEVIWLLYDNKYFLKEFEETELDILERVYNMSPKTAVVISIGLNSKKERSVVLAKKYCKILLAKYPGAVADDSSGNFSRLTQSKI